MGMRYITWIDGEEATVEIIEVDGDRVRACISSPVGDDGEVSEREVSFRSVPRDGSAYQLLVGDGEVLTGHLLSGPRGQRRVTTHAGQRVDVSVIAERDAWLEGGGMSQDAGQVTVAMPGLVVKTLVSVGDSVDVGTPLMIIEAMKMENEVKAERAGVVLKIAVNEGDPVEADVLLLEIGDAPD
jgi:biotin carboxyl carrier protein